MALLTIKIEKEDVTTSKIGTNIMMRCAQLDIVFSPEALDQLVEDYAIIKNPKLYKKAIKKLQKEKTEKK